MGIKFKVRAKSIASSAVNGKADSEFSHTQAV
ncbi:hypothetical protein GCE9029_00142 [Grimontia celer]|uniref:Uncharacterized protein n=1 Tax=Grimontia celer TaxID=1796497 RepID=A0A128ERZ4_9GAMM|nr:hypothetical protein GCE9029_00142 [Grimontia celer]